MGTGILTLEMCGIYISEQFDKDVIELVKNRGHDHFQYLKDIELNIFSSVLYIRDEIQQPICTDKYIFLYNGEIYNDCKSDTKFIKTIIDDNIWILEQEKIVDFHNALKKFLQVVYEKINKYENELSLVIILKNFVLFFKDDVGRKSLGLLKNQFGISSVKYEYEINSNLLYIYNRTEKNIISIEKINWFTQNFKNISKFTENYLKQSDARNSNLKNTKINLFDNDFVSKFKISTSKLCNENSLSDDLVLKLDKLMKDSIYKRLPDDNLIVFFSGGIDSILVALYIHLVSDIIRPIYLINTGFDNSTDRNNSKLAYHELSLKFRARKWIYIENNLSIEQIKIYKQKIYDLIYPKTGNMDFNIGTVLYFTAKKINKNGKVVFLGSGADELFCGYNKYRIENNSNKMIYDILTLSYHNITRDDRIISDNNLETRLPFLDREIINFALNLNKAELQNESENKVLLRKLLRFYDLDTLSKIPKKAMQYGTGIYKNEKYIF